VPPGDVAALRAALERLLGDPILRRRMGRAARRRVADLCSRDGVADATLRAYATEPRQDVRATPRLRVAG
jgi:glycosyltransferase involved in cell wall biosynthesis